MSLHLQYNFAPTSKTWKGNLPCWFGSGKFSLGTKCITVVLPTGKLKAANQKEGYKVTGRLNNRKSPKLTWESDVPVQETALVNQSQNIMRRTLIISPFWKGKIQGKFSVRALSKPVIGFTCGPIIVCEIGHFLSGGLRGKVELTAASRHEEKAQVHLKADSKCEKTDEDQSWPEIRGQGVRAISPVMSNQGFLKENISKFFKGYFLG